MKSDSSSDYSSYLADLMFCVLVRLNADEKNAALTNVVFFANEVSFFISS